MFGAAIAQSLYSTQKSEKSSKKKGKKKNKDKKPKENNDLNDEEAYQEVKHTFEEVFSDCSDDFKSEDEEEQNFYDALSIKQAVYSEAATPTSGESPPPQPYVRRESVASQFTPYESVSLEKQMANLMREGRDPPPIPPHQEPIYDVIPEREPVQDTLEADESAERNEVDAEEVDDETFYDPPLPPLPQEEPPVISEPIYDDPTRDDSWMIPEPQSYKESVVEAIQEPVYSTLGEVAESRPDLFRQHFNDPELPPVIPEPDYSHHDEVELPEVSPAPVMILSPKFEKQ